MIKKDRLKSLTLRKKEPKEILIEDFAEKMQNQSIDIDLRVFIDSVV